MKGRKHTDEKKEEERGLKRANVLLTWALVEWHKKEERLAGVIRCEKSCLRQLCTQTLRVSFCKALHGFGFSKQFAKNAAETLGENTGGGIMNQGPRPEFQTLTPKT